MATKLQQAATTINKLAKDEHDARRQLCIAIAGAMDLVKKESNLSWREWADENLRKPDGSKWSMHTLYSYASYGRAPEKLTHIRKSIAKHGRKARIALRTTTRTPYSNQDNSIIDQQVFALLMAWRNASPQARSKFLEAIKIKNNVA